jgi:hypothetical protein
MPLTKNQSLEEAFKRLSKLPRMYTSSELLAEGLRIYESSKRDAQSAAHCDGLGSCGAVALDLHSLSAVERGIILKDVAEFLGVEFWYSLKTPEARAAACEVYQKIRERIRAAITV